MIITEIIKNEHGDEYLHIFSDSNCNLKNSDGIIYDDIIDPIGSNKIYQEVPKEDTFEDIDNEEISAEEFLTLLQEGL